MAVTRRHGPYLTIPVAHELVNDPDSWFVFEMFARIGSRIYRGAPVTMELAKVTTTTAGVRFTFRVEPDRTSM